MNLRCAAPEDFRAYAGFDIPHEFCICPPIGYTLEHDGKITGLGLVTWDVHGRAWGWLENGPSLPAVMLHRRALAMLAVLREVGEPALHAFCSQTIPRSAKWLRRLGFQPAPELTTDPDHPVWRKCPI